MSLVTRSLHAVVRAAWPLSVAVVALPAFPQQATLGGTVLSDGAERPLANAEVTIESPKKIVRSDSLGNFAFAGLTPGRYRVTIRLLGFEALQTDVALGKPDDAFEADFILKPSVTTLKAVDVKAVKTEGPWAIKLADFDERRAVGIGRYLTADVFEKAEGTPLSAIIMSKIPGVRAINSNGRRWLASSRGGGGYGKKEGATRDDPTPEAIPPGCYMQVIVNGMIVYNGNAGQSMFDVDALNSKDVIGFEFYTTATTPLQYNATKGSRMGSCGTVIIWTKGG